MINRYSYSILTGVFVFFSLVVTAQTGITVKATADKSSILIGEPIRLTLQADIPETQPIRFFQVDSIPHFEFLSREKIDTVNTSDGTLLSQHFYITSFDSGQWVIPVFTLGDQLTTDSIAVDVIFSPSPFDTNQPYHDIKDIIEVSPEDEKKKSYWWYYVIGGVLVLTILIFLLRKKKKPVEKLPELPPDPYKVALQGLDRLQKDKPGSKEYYSVLVDIFRIYVLSKRGIHSLQKTTDDLVLQLKSLNIKKDEFERLAQALRLSDFVKFAKYEPTPADDRNSFESIRKAIEQIEQMQ